jgi:hypothetical protein
MAEYKATWSIDVSAKSYKDAANHALEILRERGNEARFFIVENRKTGKAENIEAEEPCI